MALTSGEEGKAFQEKAWSEIENVLKQQEASLDD